MSQTLPERYFAALDTALRSTIATTRNGVGIALSEALDAAVEAARAAQNSGGKIIFIGNGGSAAIASHMAIDFTKNGGLRAIAFNDPAALTCLGNDLGYENIFHHPVAAHTGPNDLLIAISSSGRSPNILNGVSAARECGAKVLTLSGFGAKNPLRETGDINLYVAVAEYGLVEIAHLTLCHAILDLAMGWPDAPWFENIRTAPANSA